MLLPTAEDEGKMWHGCMKTAFPADCPTALIRAVFARNGVINDDQAYTGIVVLISFLIVFRTQTGYHKHAPQSLLVIRMIQHLISQLAQSDQLLEPPADEPSFS